MATANPSGKHTDILKCSICLEPFRSPRSLPCLHTFCEECLDTYIHSQGQEISSFTCPICCRTTTPPNSTLPTNTWAVAFPLNHMIVSLMQCDNLSEDGLCEQCKRKRTQTSADYWCLECQENICSVCQEYHLITKALMHHKIVDISQKSQHSRPDSFDKQYEICQQHQGKHLEVFCLGHRQLCCVVCFVTNHRECKHIIDIDEAVKLSCPKETASKVTDLFKNINTNMVGLADRLSANKTDLSAQKVEITQTMEQVVAEIIDGIQKQLSSLKNETAERFSEEGQVIDKNKKAVEEFIRNIEFSYKLLDTLAEKGSPRQLFVTIHSLLSQLQSHNEKVETCLQSDSHVSFIFHINEATKAWKDAVKKFGTLEVWRNPRTHTNTAIKTTADLFGKVGDASLNIHGMSSQVPVSPSLNLSKAQPHFIKTFKKEHMGNTTVIDCIFLRNGNYLIADYHKSSLKEFDKDYNFKREYKLEGKPSCLYRMDGEDEVFVVINRQTIRKYLLSERLSLTSTLSVSDVWGFAFVDKKIIVSSTWQVAYLSQDGTVLKKVQKNSQTNESFVAVSTQQRMIYHTDGDAVVCRDYDFTEKFRYTHSELRYPIGLCLDQDNNIYVCGNQSGNIHQIARDGSKGRVLIDKCQDMKQPYNIMYHAENNTLAITSATGGVCIELYELK